LAPLSSESEESYSIATSLAPACPLRTGSLTAGIISWLSGSFGTRPALFKWAESLAPSKALFTLSFFAWILRPFAPFAGQFLIEAIFC
jgi:hypothetical protein